jgi:hypothetical protein
MFVSKSLRVSKEDYKIACYAWVRTTASTFAETVLYIRAQFSADFYSVKFSILAYIQRPFHKFTSYWGQVSFTKFVS